MRRPVMLTAGLLVVVAIATPGSADPVEVATSLARRVNDGFGWATNSDSYGGHNHFHVKLWDHRGDEPFMRRLPGIEGELRATVRWIDTVTGSTRVRSFSTIARDGYEPFSEGPLCCPYYEGVLVALPHDFGGVRAIVEFEALLPDIPEECPPPTERDACGGRTVGFYNTSAILLVTDPWEQDAADGEPELISLL